MSNSYASRRALSVNDPPGFSDQAGPYGLPAQGYSPDPAPMELCYPSDSLSAYNLIYRGGVSGRRRGPSEAIGVQPVERRRLLV
jgi:hypothetical protein